MSSIASYERYKLDHANIIREICVKVGKLAEAAHWELIDEMKGVLGSEAANNSTDSEQDQENAISSAEEWVSNNCSSGGLEEDVSMALWLRGFIAGEEFLMSKKAPDVEVKPARSARP